MTSIIYQYGDDWMWDRGKGETIIFDKFYFIMNIYMV